MVLVPPSIDDVEVSSWFGDAVESVNLQRVDLPVSICESGWVILDIILAGGSKRGASSAGAPHVASPVTTESRIEDLKPRQLYFV